MSLSKPTYHLPPNFSTAPPPKGPFHLGTVIRDFDRREQMRPLNHGKDRDGKDKRIAIGTDDIYRDHKGGFVATRRRLKNGELGLWAKCIGLDGLGGEASISAKRSENDTYKFASVETDFFYPSPSYISHCMELSDVDEYMRVTRYKKAVYLVTGLKVAKGAAVRLEANSGIKGKLEGGLNSPDVAPVKLGVGVGGNAEDNPVDEFSESSDIVVGIQCLKIYYKFGLFSREKQRKDVVFTDGATFLGDEAKKEEVSFEDLALVGPENYNNPKFSAHTQAGGEGQDDEVWMLPAGLA
ncbi:hypothetical protein S40293_10011 [Stachybotrys chartarum IBT 40293]|nr:hypothetical protein S40293_10011 [Stachybotrys chartarum IBT 40293]